MNIEKFLKQNEPSLFRRIFPYFLFYNNKQMRTFDFVLYDTTVVGVPIFTPKHFIDLQRIAQPKWYKLNYIGFTIWY